MGWADATQQIINNMVELTKRQLDHVTALLPEGFFDYFQKELSQASNREFFACWCDTLEAHFTPEQLNELVEVFSTPIMQVFSKKQAAISIAMMGYGEKWGEALGKRLIQMMNDSSKEPTSTTH